MKHAAKSLAWLAWAATAFLSVRVALRTAADVRRYDRLRSMSGEGPLISELPAMVGSVVEAERKSFPNLLQIVLSLPNDALRYARMKSM